MAIHILIKDETATGKPIREIPVSFESELTTVKDVITARVKAEVIAYNEKLPEYFQGLVQPSDAEQTLNGFRLRERKKIDWQKQLTVALDAFSKNAYFILIDNIQAESLDQMVVVSQNSKISFVKLTPLVGG